MMILRSELITDLSWTINNHLFLGCDVFFSVGIPWGHYLHKVSLSQDMVFQPTTWEDVIFIIADHSDGGYIFRYILIHRF